VYACCDAAAAALSDTAPKASAAASLARPIVGGEVWCVVCGVARVFTVGDGCECELSEGKKVSRRRCVTLAILGSALSKSKCCPIWDRAEGGAKIGMEIQSPGCCC
jgi:hypothetical protein